MGTTPAQPNIIQATRTRSAAQQAANPIVDLSAYPVLTEEVLRPFASGADAGNAIVGNGRGRLFRPDREQSGERGAGMESEAWRY